MVKHCKEKIVAAQGINPDTIKIIGHGEFSVKSSDTFSQEHYKVFFCDDNRMPHCSCYGWKMSAYPCKHFFAIFAKYPAWSWDALSSLYRNSLFMILDEMFDAESNAHEESSTNDKTAAARQEEPCQLETEMPVLDDSKDNINLAREIGRKRTCNGPSGPAVRELIDEVRRASFLIEDSTDLIKEVHQKLSEIKDTIYKHASTEKGIPLRQVTPKKQAKLKSSQKLKTLRLRKRKNPFTGRMGLKKEKMMKAASGLNVAQSNENDKENEIIEEVINDGKEHLGSTKFSFSTDGAVIPNFHIESDSDDEPKEHTFATRQLLKKTDLKRISENEMLNDTIIHVFQGIMQKQHPEINGLQDPILGQTLSFSIYRNKRFVQVLHDGRLHWICISTYHCEPGEVFYFDSLFSGRISDKVKQQLCSIMHSSSTELTVKILPVQQQSNGVDCGAYAIAFVNYILKEKKNPVEVAFDQQKKRHHLLRSLAANRLEPFPTSTKSVKGAVEKKSSCNCIVAAECAGYHQTIKYLEGELKALIQPECLARVASWLAFVVTIFMGHENGDNKGQLRDDASKACWLNKSL